MHASYSYRVCNTWLVSRAQTHTQTQTTLGSQHKHTFKRHTRGHSPLPGLHNTKIWSVDWFSYVRRYCSKYWITFRVVNKTLTNCTHGNHKQLFPLLGNTSPALILGFKAKRLTKYLCFVNVSHLCRYCKGKSLAMSRPEAWDNTPKHSYALLISMCTTYIQTHTDTLTWDEKEAL